MEAEAPGGRHPNRTNGAPTPTTSPKVFYRLDALPATQPTASKHWRPQSDIDPKITRDDKILLEAFVTCKGVAGL